MPCQLASQCGWRVAAPARLAPGFQGGGKSASGAEREESAGCSSREPRRKPGLAGGHSLTSTHSSQGEPEQQQRLHAESQIHAATRSAAALKSRSWAERPGTPDAEKGASRAGAGACGHGVRVAPGPREGALPSSAARCWPRACSPPLLCSRLLCLRGVARRSWPRWLWDSGKNSPSGRLCLLRYSQLPVGPGCWRECFPAHFGGCIL